MPAMSLRKLACRVGDDERDRRLDQFLAGALPLQGERLSRRQVRRLIDAGAVWVDGRRVRVASKRVRPAARVEVWVGDTPVGPAPEAAAAIGGEHVLFEDDFLIAVDKPAGMPAQATVADAVHDLYHLLRRFLAERDGGAPYLALHHRLDRGTSGVMLFARRREVNRALAQAFSQQRVRKVYHALVAITAPQPPPGAWTVRDLLSPLRDFADGPRRVVRVDAGGRPAETEIRPLQWFPGAAWVEAVPKTGRTHQVRVHLADSGLPVLGDAIYGRDAVPKIPAPRLMLHALSLTLEHPSTGEALVLESPLPDDFRAEVRLLECAPPPGLC
jgi:RluA family pseudouridine synthase